MTAHFNSCLPGKGTVTFRTSKQQTTRTEKHNERVYDGPVLSTQRSHATRALPNDRRQQELEYDFFSTISRKWNTGRPHMDLLHNVKALKSGQVEEPLQLYIHRLAEPSSFQIESWIVMCHSEEFLILRERETGERIEKDTPRMCLRSGRRRSSTSPRDLSSSGSRPTHGTRSDIGLGTKQRATGFPRLIDRLQCRERPRKNDRGVPALRCGTVCSKTQYLVRNEAGRRSERDGREKRTRRPWDELSELIKSREQFCRSSRSRRLFSLLLIWQTNSRRTPPFTSRGR